MRLRVTFEMDETDRAALAARYGQKRLVSRDQVESWITGIVSTTMDDIRYEYETGEARPRDEEPVE